MYSITRKQSFSQLSNMWHALFILIVLSFASFSYEACTPDFIQGTHCVPIGPLTCMGVVENGTGLSWFQVQEKCRDEGARLVSLNEHVHARHLAMTLHTTIADYDQIMIGVQMSVKRDQVMFSTLSNEKDSSQCSSLDTDVCLVTHDEGDCFSLGCCWTHGKCQFPETQRIPIYNGSENVVDVSADHTRQCIALSKGNGSFARNPTLRAIDCTHPIAGRTGFVCEYKCDNDWPIVEKQNISWDIATTPSSLLNTTATSNFFYTSEHNLNTTVHTPYTSTVLSGGTSLDNTTSPSNNTSVDQTSLVSSTTQSHDCKDQGSAGSVSANNKNKQILLLALTVGGGLATQMNLSISQFDP